MRHILKGLTGFILLTSIAACGSETEQTTTTASKVEATQSVAKAAADKAAAQAAEAAKKADMAKAAAEAKEKADAATAVAVAKTSDDDSADDTAAANGTVHEVRMLNMDPDDRSNKMVYIPRVLRIAPGDTVRFIPENPGHNSASTRGMTPDGFEGWKSQINKTFDVTLTMPGIYGYNCTPHRVAGMVGLVIVEGDGMLANLEDAKEVRQAGKSRGVWDDIWAEAEASGALTP